MKHAGGRPPIYTKELAELLCEFLAQGMSLRSACKEKGMPAVRTVFGWMRDHPEFLPLYARAKEEAADAMAEEINDIADDALTEASKGDPKSSNARVAAMKLRIDTRRWYMAKFKPKKYGDKIDVTSDGKALPTPIYGSKSKSK